jgi:hypothetical protein
VVVVIHTIDFLAEAVNLVEERKKQINVNLQEKLMMKTKKGNYLIIINLMNLIFII